MAAKITKVRITKFRRRGWPGWKVSLISEGGRAMVAWEFDRYQDARRAAIRDAAEHRAKLIDEA